jgi:hypothetical protein
MGARHKLNEMYAIGSALVAAWFGLIAESWLVFLVVLIGVLGLMLHGGDIRLQQPANSQAGHSPHRSPRGDRSRHRPARRRR